MTVSRWQPTKILRFVRAIPSSARTAIVETDAGTGYLKALGSGKGPHTLACELVGTRLAEWLGLAVFEFALVEVDAMDEIPFVNERQEPDGAALQGPAFISKKENGETWGGKQRQLKRLENPEDISRLVVFDTWTLNCDRYGPHLHPTQSPRINRGNVFLSEHAPKGKLCLKAIDHTHCFTCGRALTKRVAHLDIIRDARVFGRFPEFVKHLNPNVVRDCATRLATIEKQTVASMMRDLPPVWEVTLEVQEAWAELIVQRASFVANTIERKLWPETKFAFNDEEEPGHEPS